jgi:hypothetical protein
MVKKSYAFILAFRRRRERGRGGCLPRYRGRCNALFILKAKAERSPKPGAQSRAGRERYAHALLHYGGLSRSAAQALRASARCHAPSHERLLEAPLPVSNRLFLTKGGRNRLWRRSHEHLLLGTTLWRTESINKPGVQSRAGRERYAHALLQYTTPRAFTVGLSCRAPLGAG